MSRHHPFRSKLAVFSVAGILSACSGEGFPPASAWDYHPPPGPVFVAATFCDAIATQTERQAKEDGFDLSTQVQLRDTAKRQCLLMVSVDGVSFIR